MMISDPRLTSSRLKVRSAYLTLSEKFQNLLNKHIKIKGGDYKGYEGILKSVNNHIARVELSSKAKVVSVAKEYIIDPQELSKEVSSLTRSGGRTPSYYPKSGNFNSSNINSPSMWNSGATRKHFY